MSRQTDIQNLVRIYNRRLQLLKEQEAYQGLSTPPHILLEIEDIEAKLATLQTALREAEHGQEPATFNFDLEQELIRLRADESLQHPSQTGGVTIAGIQGGTINVANLIAGNVGGDVVAGDKVGGDKVGRDKIIGPVVTSNSAQAVLETALAQWKQEIETKIEALTLDSDDKASLKKTAAKVEAEAAKGADADPGKIANWINWISALAPDIIEVTAKTLQNPLAGVGLVLEKINDRVKLERQG